MANAAQMKVSDEIAISIQTMNKWYGTFHVLRDIDLTVYRGERIVICGPSGSGKSTLIRCINALEEHQKGSIEVDGTLLSSDLKNIDKIRSQRSVSNSAGNSSTKYSVVRSCVSYKYNDWANRIATANIFCWPRELLLSLIHI